MIYSGMKFYKKSTTCILNSVGIMFKRKPPMKGGHTHNHVFNAGVRNVFRGKDSRKISTELKRKIYKSMRIIYGIDENTKT